MPFKVTARNRDQEFSTIVTVAGPTLLELLQAQQIPIKSSCMGKGICRQCRVQVSKGIAPIQASDRKAFNEEQLQTGWRLSCGIRPKSAMEVFFPQSFVFQDHIEKLRDPVSEWWFAGDLGTTGVEIAAVDSSGVWATIKSLNKQVVMGADVMTRLEYAQRNGVKPMFERFKQQVVSLCTKLQSQSQSYPSTGEMYVAGNSAITTFVMQWPIEQLATSPYQPEAFAAQTVTIDNLNVHTLPLLYSFVGGDLWAGLFLLWKQGAFKRDAWVLMDVGTNSEILFWDQDSLFVSSTPAGPAFEGSSISIGMRAELGAVNSLSPRTEPSKWGGFWDFTTIGEDIPKGICGSALVQMISELVRMGWVSLDGEVLQPDRLKLTNSLALTQDDIREFQLAKSAIQTGLELVQAEGKRTPKTLYLAGSFGENLPLDACRKMGLLPEWPTETLGNSSLSGTILWGQATSVERQEFLEFVQSRLKPIELALRDEFQAAFVKNMNLG